MTTRIATDITATNAAISLATDENLIVPTRVLITSTAGSGVFGSGDNRVVQVRGEIDADHSAIKLNGDGTADFFIDVIGSAASKLLAFHDGDFVL